MSQRIAAISLWQPWATLLVTGAKKIETRSWAPRGLKPGQPVAIHAAKHWTADERALCEEDPFFRRYLTLAARRGLWDMDTPPLGVVVGIATFATAGSTKRYRDQISDHERAFGDYSDRRWAWMFRDPCPLTPPIPLRGERGIFTWEAPDDLLVLPAEVWPESSEKPVTQPTLASVSASTPAPATTAQTRVVHVRRDEYDVYIGRPMPGFHALGWGNPFRSGVGGDAIDKYRTWVLTQPALMARLPELRGKRLGCWCAPQGGLPGDLYGRVCHGEVLAALADGQEQNGGDAT